MILTAASSPIERMRAAAGELKAVLGVLANENRLLLLCLLSQGEKSVGELEASLALRQPNLSQQLGVLRSIGVVGTRREGQRVYYSLADTRLEKLLGVLDDLYCPDRECSA